MSFVNKASMHELCDLVLEVTDGPTNQQEVCLVKHKTSSIIVMDQSGYITLRVEKVLVRVIGGVKVNDRRCCKSRSWSSWDSSCGSKGGGVERMSRRHITFER
jgi:hypothetical protein